MPEPRCSIVVDHRDDFSERYTIPLPPRLERCWGGGFDCVYDPRKGELPFVWGNFVIGPRGEFNIPSAPGGGTISQGNVMDAFAVALMRALADAVLVGARTVQNEHTHLWTPQYITRRPHIRAFAHWERELAELRRQLRKERAVPMTIVLSSSGRVNFSAETFRGDAAAGTFVATSERGARRIRREFPSYRNVLVFGERALDARALCAHLKREVGATLLLHEGGKSAFASFVRKRLVSQMQLTRVVKEPRTVENAEYLFSHSGRVLPLQAPLMTIRRDAEVTAYFYSVDMRKTRKLT